MKKFDVKKRLFAFVSVALMLCMTLGLFSAFPFVSVIEADAAEEEKIYYPSQDYVVLDADDMKDRLTGENCMKASFGKLDGIECLRMQSRRTDKGYDPYVSYTPGGSYSADDYKYIAMVLQSSAGMNIDFQMFYTTDAVSHYTETASVRAKYAATEDWQVVLFDISQKDNWKGEIKSMRFDIYSGLENETNGKVVSIAAIILCSTPEDAYNSSFSFLKDNLYTPVQALDNFTESEVDCFTKADGIVPGTENEKWLPTLDTTVSAKNGNLVYNYKFDSTVAHSGPDPYAGFFYHDLMDERGVAESERLDTSEFRYTVVKYRTKGDVGNKPLFQTYYYANGNKWPTFIDGNPMSPSTNYIASSANDWKMLVIDMQANGDDVGWKGRFDGFRVDWCSPSSKDTTAEMEISDIMFFADGEEANGFVNAFNTLKIAVPEENEETYTENYNNPIKLTEDCLMLLPEQIAEKIENSDNSKGYVTSNKGIGVLRLETTKTASDPFVTLKTGGVNANEYKYVTIMARSSVWTSSAMKLTYGNTGKGDSFVGRYKSNGEWTLITISLDGVEAWKGIIDSMKLTYLCYDPQFTGFGAGTSVDIAGIAFSKTADAFYDSAYYLMTNVYRPAQVISNFTEDDREAFNKDVKRTEVSFKDGNLVLSGKCEPEQNYYNDPWASFHYKTLMDIRGVDASERITTADFNTTVIRYRTSPQIEVPGMGLFLYLGSHMGVFRYDGEHFYQVSSSYSATHYGTWRSMSIVMNGNSAMAPSWTGDFNGFRMDWCNNSNVGEYMEISEMFFFNDSEAAKQFTDTVNSLYEPTAAVYNDEYMTSVPSSEDYLLISPENLSKKIEDSANSTHYLAKNAGVPVVRLEVTDAAENPYVTYSPDNVSADEYKFVTLMVKSSKIYGAMMSMNYSTDKSPKIANQYVSASYSTSSDWQFITVNLSGKESFAGIIDKLQLGYIYTGYDVVEGVTYDIAGLAFCKDEDAVCDAAYYMAAQVYKPTQILSDFSENDADYFGGKGVSGHTDLSVENGNIVYTGVAHEGDSDQTLANDPQKRFDYIDYVNSKNIKPMTTDVFQYTVIRYRANGVNSGQTGVELFIFTGSNNSPMIRVDGTSTCHSGEGKYMNTDTWKTFVVNMAEDDGLQQNSGESKFAWNIEGETVAFNGFRFDWCGSTKVGGQMEVSDFIFFASAADAERFSAMVNTVSIPSAVGDNSNPGDDWPFDDPNLGSGTEESIPDFEDTTEETVENTEEDTTEESIEDTTEDVSEDTVESTDEETTDKEEGPVFVPEDETENTDNSGGSQAPFYIVCVALAGLTLASLLSVLVIRIRSKNGEIAPEETNNEENQ